VRSNSVSESPADGVGGRVESVGHRLQIVHRPVGGCSKATAVEREAVSWEQLDDAVKESVSSERVPIVHELVKAFPADLASDSAGRDQRLDFRSEHKTRWQHAIVE